MEDESELVCDLLMDAVGTDHRLRTFDEKCHHRNLPKKWRP